MRALALALLLGACKKPGPDGPFDLTGPAPLVDGHVEVLYPTLDLDVVSGRSGLTIPVPEGWEAQQPPESSGVTVRLQHVPTGTTIDVREALSLEDLPPWEEDCAVAFDDQADYTRVPALRPLRVQVCAPGTPQEPLREAYTGTAAAAVRLEITWPPALRHRARREVGALLRRMSSRQ